MTEHKDKQPTGERVLQGTGVSRGTAFGHALFVASTAFLPTEKTTQVDVPFEIGRLKRAVDNASARLRMVSTSHETPAETRAVLASHLLLVDSIAQRAEPLIASGTISAEASIAAVADDFSQGLRKRSSPHLSEKRLDIEDVVARLLIELGEMPASNTDVRGRVVLSPEIRPSVVLQMAKDGVAGVIVEHAGWTSHSSIVAREARIPMVAGIDVANAQIENGAEIIVDGDNGIVIVEPSSRASIAPAAVEKVEAAFAEPGLPLRTLDGADIVLSANVESPAAYETARRSGARGIGLYRSDMLVSVEGSIPDEETQVAAYRAMSEACSPEIVNIRTFDILPHTDDDRPIPQANPFLGLRSIRYCLSDKDVFRAQLRAIVRANSLENLRIVIPFVSGVEEVRATRNILEEELAALSPSGSQCQPPMVGAMIEVPSAVMTADALAREADFLCLGTNDLVQYLLAVDRDNERVSDWYKTVHPAVIRALRTVRVAAHEAGTELTVCGEMAGSPFYLPLLLGLGVRRLSMGANSTRKIADIIRRTDISKAEAVADAALKCSTATEIESLLTDQQNAAA